MTHYILLSSINVMIGIFFILGFIRRKRSKTFMGSWVILVVGLLFISDLPLRELFGGDVSIVEFAGVVLILWLAEKFISVNTRKRFSSWSIIASITGGVLVISFMGMQYSFMCTVLALTILSLRVLDVMKVSSWGSRSAFYVSFSFGLFSIVAYLLNMRKAADFLYFGMVLMLMLVMIESSLIPADDTNLQ